ncbi:uncharacterized protein LOC18435699 [Amborella trichopoda]|uniref:Uncharacterized protein n=1 Tax=Amborella trichopoda TaxID=13333 RepID=W1PIC4_AMBTC|nr:uncharacterized protein LOC18435699 [Amborella trichopoda]ERN07479.1 hypothetical protein AMTR_s00019p00255980 [Amborella trichopoda]|eukprot:XP_011623898.1 uncharacterized protein LOC18435699 [Amborella trichopoda]
MGTEVLRPQDCLRDSMRVPVSPFQRRRAPGGGNPNWNLKRAPKKKSQFDSSNKAKDNQAKNLVMGQVTILKRGQPLIPAKDQRSPQKPALLGRDPIVSSTEFLGPDPAMVPKKIGLTDLKEALSSGFKCHDVYAGSGFSVSPSPSALPLPSFSRKKSLFPTIDDSATKDLRRLLKLE